MYTHEVCTSKAHENSHHNSHRSIYLVCHLLLAVPWKMTLLAYVSRFHYFIWSTRVFIVSLLYQTRLQMKQDASLKSLKRLQNKHLTSSDLVSCVQRVWLNIFSSKRCNYKYNNRLVNWTKRHHSKSAEWFELRF